MKEIKKKKLKHNEGEICTVDRDKGKEENGWSKKERNEEVLKKGLKKK